MEELARKYHQTQYRNKNKVPYFEHLVGVRSLFVSTAKIAGEITDEAQIKNMSDAALGHDLIEDTEVTEEEIIATSNEYVLGLIKELSNPVDDAHTDEYMQQLSTASEEARILKYCDLLENTTSVSYGLQDLGLDWAHNFYLPILENTTKTLAATTFEKYPKTAQLLRQMLQASTDLLFNKISSVEQGERRDV